MIQKTKARFTPYIFEVTKDDNFLPPKELLTAIGDKLCQEMKNRNLWDKSPSWLGCSGDKWERYSDEFNNLIKYFYGKSILNRLNSLQARAKKGLDIDNYVIGNIKNDLTREQQKWDKVGHAVYENLNFVVMHLVEEEILKICRCVKKWKTKIHRNTLLAFSSCDSTTIADDKLMYEALRQNTWFVDQSFLTKLGQKNNRQEEHLRDMFCQLRASNVNRFYFCDLIEPVKKAVRFIVDEPAYQIAKNVGVDSNDETDDGEVSEEEFIIDYEPDEIDLDECCQKLHSAIDDLRLQRRVRQKLKKILDARLEAIKQQITPLSLEELARRFGVSVDIEQKKQQEWATRLNISIEQFQQAQAQSTEGLAELLGISMGELNKAINTPLSTEEKARILGISVEELEQAIQQKMKLPSHQKLGDVLGCSAGSINENMKRLRDLARQVEEQQDWGKATLGFVAQMLK
jgi:biotin operon repressor